MDPEDHERWMREALALARQARERGDHPFGALLVRKGTVVATGLNSVNTDGDPTRHAELALVSRVSRSLPPQALAQAVMYASTEPCPMCCGALYWGGVRRVVFGFPAAALEALTGEGMGLSAQQVLAGARQPVELVGPVLEDEAAEVHADFWTDGG